MYECSIIYLIYQHQIPFLSLACVVKLLLVLLSPKLTWASNSASSFNLVTSDISVREVLRNKPSNYYNCCYCRTGVSKYCFIPTAHMHAALWYKFRITFRIETAYKSNKTLKVNTTKMYIKKVFINCIWCKTLSKLLFITFLNTSV